MSAVNSTDNPSTNPPLAYGVMDAAEALGIGWDLFAEHVAPHVKWVRLGRKKIVARTELERFLADRGQVTLP
jgi:hypothetical protein